MNRHILHSDMNCFYASVECMLDPSLRGKKVAVGGSTEERHGIILTKNYAAKAYGIQTGETIGSALDKCPDLIVIPPHYNEYIKYSKKAREIYSRYTPYVEPFGMDECWLDITGCTHPQRDPVEIAEEIRETMKYELGLTVSIGVSFNKIFAKLGSDMKKPDAITAIYKDTFKNQIWNLPASDLLGVGRASKSKLDYYGINTIGELANTDLKFLKLVMKSHGETLWKFANGYDSSAVMLDGYISPIKSIGHGITTVRDLENDRDVWCVILELSQDIGHKLRTNDLCACGIAIYVRDKDLFSRGWQAKLELSTQSETYISQCAMKLFNEKYSWDNSIRSITVRAINLIPSSTPIQQDLFHSRDELDRLEKIDKVKDEIRERFGNGAIVNASIMENDATGKIRSDGVRMPSGLLTLR